MSQQLCLFKFERPLLDRFGAAFFKAIPRKPGVYLFIGARGRVLYVGQSKNLRLRLSYYKNARPEREPRKIIRLVHQTRRIELHRCDTPQTAQLREIELIRDKRPRFNTALASSRAYSFFGLARDGANVTLRLVLEPTRRDDEQFFGAFKNRGLCRRAFLSLARVLWGEQAKPQSAYDLPLWMNESTRASEWTLPSPAASELAPFLEGRESTILARVEKLALQCEPFLRKLFESDLLVLAEFFLLAQRMREIRQFAGASEIIPPENLDTLHLRQRWFASGN